METANTQSRSYTLSYVDETLTSDCNSYLFVMKELLLKLVPSLKKGDLFIVTPRGDCGFLELSAKGLLMLEEIVPQYKGEWVDVFWGNSWQARLLRDSKDLDRLLSSYSNPKYLNVLPVIKANSK